MTITNSTNTHTLSLINTPPQTDTCMCCSEKQTYFLSQLERTTLILSKITMTEDTEN